MLKSTVYLLGAGPGDRSLITVKGLELIKKADCIIYDSLVNPELLKSSRKDCKLIYVGKRAGAHTLSQAKINQLLVREARTCGKVVRLKGGDPFIFGRGAEEASYLRKKEINFEIVPGVTSAIAVPAYAGIPLTQRRINSTVGFITGHEDPAKTDSAIDWAAIVKAMGTMVFLMGAGNLGLIAKKLMENGKPKDTPVALIRQGTTSGQETFTGSLGNISGLARENNVTPPAIIVVGETVELRKELNWFEGKPLFGKRIIVTRARQQSSTFCEKLTELGAQVIEIPLIKVVSLRADRQLEDCFLSDKYDWIFFTSQNGVNEFSAFLERTGKDSRIFGGAKICAIGPETAKILHGIGISPDYVPSQFVAETIVRHFKNLPAEEAGITPKGLVVPKTLVLRAKKARDILPLGLKEAGFKVKVIDLYDTVIPKESALTLQEALKNRIDFVTFTSSSTAKNFIKLLGKRYHSSFCETKIASIGPVTSATLKELGLKVDAQAKAYTIDGLVQAICKLATQDKISGSDLRYD